MLRARWVRATRGRSPPRPPPRTTHPMAVLPCPLCGYDAPGCECDHCGRTARETSLAAPPPGPATELLEGLWALPRGLGYLLRTPRTKRLLVPPLLLTLAAFAALLAWLSERLQALLEAARLGDPGLLGPGEGWWTRVARWIVEHGLLAWTASLGAWTLFVLAAGVVGYYTFSIVFEALAGPFLDELQARLEARWFGADPRAAIERPTDIPTRRCATLSALAALPALGFLALAWRLEGPASWLALLGIPGSFAAAGRLDREYGKWLAWVACVEGRALLVSVEAAALTGVLLLLFLPLQLVPGIGWALFVPAAGFATAITLLDIPASRRQWSLRQRLRFVRLHPLALTAFGAVAGLLFAVPLVGPLLMVPAASIGGQWLLCRLDKNGLRPAGQRLAPRAAPRGAPAT